MGSIPSRTGGGLREDFMKRAKGLFLALTLLAPAVLYAGQIYGTIVADGQPVKGATIEVQCGKEAAVTGSTGGDGAYRINVPHEGQCTFALPSFEGRPSTTVFSGPNPASYNFELAKLADGKYELRRR
jgi:hypothetical protein